MNLSRRPLFLFTVAYVSGIVCAVQAKSYPLAGIGIAGGVFLIASVLSAKVISRTILGIFAAVFAIGFLRTFVFQRAPAGDVSGFAQGKLVHLTGKVASDPEPVDRRVRFLLEGREIRTYTGEYPAKGRVMVTLYQPRHGQSNPRDRTTPFYGEMVRIHGRLEPPPTPSNPGGAYRYDQYLARKRVFCVLTAGLEEVRVLGPASGSVSSLAFRFKRALISKALELLPPVHARLLIGILLGNYAALPLDVQAAFLRSGTMHLLAASGYNCGVLAMIFGFLMRRLTAPRVLMYAMLIALLWGFTIIAGAGPSIVRASVMMSAFLAAYLLRRTPDLPSSVFFAGLVILAANPLNLYDIGFQLSFAAVLALILMMPLVQGAMGEWLSPARPVGGSPLMSCIRCSFWAARSTVLAFAVSVAAIVATAPITAYYFNYVSVVSVVATALTAVLVIALTAAGIGVLALGSVLPAIGHAVSFIPTWISACMLGVVSQLGNYPWSSISVRSPTPLFLLLYYAALVIALEYAYRKAAEAKDVAGDRRPRMPGRRNLVEGTSA